MSARGIIGGLAGMAASAVKHPRSTTEQALLGAKEMATTGVIVADKLLRKGKGKAAQGTGSTPQQAPAQARQAAASATATAAEKVEKAAGKVEKTAEKVADRADEAETEAARSKPAPKPPAKKPAAKKAPAKKAAEKKSTAKKSAAKKAPAKKSQPKKDDHDVVLAVDFPAPPEEPPVDVVGEALAKEAEEERQNAPKGSTLPPVRDKDEAAADPATLKAVRAEAEMMTKAASPRKS